MNAKICIWFKNEKFFKTVKSFFSDLKVCGRHLDSATACENDVDLTIIESPDIESPDIESPDIEASEKTFNMLTAKLNSVDGNYMKINTDNEGNLKSLNIFHTLDEDASFVIKQAGDLLLGRNSELSIFEVPDLLQLFATERKTLALKIIGVHQTGIIAFKNGDIEYARVDSLVGEFFGEEAVYHILSWKQPAIWSFPVPNNITPNIESNLSFLLMDAMRYLDELKVSGKSLESVSFNIKQYLEIVNIFSAKMIIVTEENKIRDQWFDETLYTKESVNKVTHSLLSCYNACKKLAQTFFVTEEFLTIDYDSAFVLAVVGKKYNIFFVLDKVKNIFLVKMVLLKMINELQI